MITVISKHLRLLHNRFPVSNAEFLGAIHYIEQLRYHAHQFMLLSSGDSETPDDFDPGIDVSGDELDHLYSKMTMWFELESFVKTSKSFLDHLWRIAANGVFQDSCHHFFIFYATFSDSCSDLSGFNATSLTCSHFLTSPDHRWGFFSFACLYTTCRLCRISLSCPR